MQDQPTATIRRVISAAHVPIPRGKARKGARVLCDCNRHHSLSFNTAHGPLTRPPSSKTEPTPEQPLRSLWTQRSLVYTISWHWTAEACHRQSTLQSHEEMFETGLLRHDSLLDAEALYTGFFRERCRLMEAQSVFLGKSTPPCIGAADTTRPLLRMHS